MSGDLHFIPITGTSSLLCHRPPHYCSSVLSALRLLPLAPFLLHCNNASPVPYQSLNKSHATSTPNTTESVNRFSILLFLCWNENHSFDVVVSLYDASSVVHFRSSLFFLPDAFLLHLFLNAHYIYF